LAAQKQPTFSGVLNVKTLLEAGYLSRGAKNGASPGGAQRAGTAPVHVASELDLARLSKILPAAWREWWRAA